jgi:hypothetical protein
MEADIDYPTDADLLKHAVGKRRRTGVAMGEVDRLTTRVVAIARHTLRQVQAVARNARRIGWACECGERLRDDLVCDCGRSCRLTPAGTLQRDVRPGRVGSSLNTRR